MNEDKLLRELAQLADEEDRRLAERLDTRWDDLAAGRLSPEDEAVLRAENAGSPELELAYEGFRPLAADVRAAIVRDAAARLAAGKPPAEPARVLAFPSRIARKPWLAGLAVAASLLLAVALWRFPGGSQTPLPAYQLSSDGGLQAERSGHETSTDVLRLAPGVRFSVVLSPETVVAGEVAVHAFVQQGESPRRWQGAERLATTFEGGAVRISGIFAGDLEPGAYTLVLAVGRPGALPKAEELRRPVPHPSWQLLEKKLAVIAPEGKQDR